MLLLLLKKKKPFRFLKVISLFLTIYPGYNFKDIKEEHAITFWALLEEGLRLKHENFLVLSQISALPYMKEGDQKNFIKELTRGTQGNSDIIKDKDDYSGIDKLKKEM